MNNEIVMILALVRDSLVIDQTFHEPKTFSAQWGCSKRGHDQPCWRDMIQTRQSHDVIDRQLVCVSGIYLAKHMYLFFICKASLCAWPKTMN